MGITTSSIITCDGCKEVLDGESDFFYLQTSVNGEPKSAFPGIVVFCNNDCLKTFANSLP
jgi:hypothetical protein